MWDSLLLSLLPTLIGGMGKGVKSIPDYPEVGDLVYSNDWVKYQSMLDGDYDVVVNKGELIGQIVQMNVTDSKEDYVYHMKISRPNGSIVYVPILNPYDDTYDQMNNEWYRVAANPNYSYPSTKQTTPQIGGTTPTKKPIPKTPEPKPTAPEEKTPKYPPIEEPEPKPNYWLIGGLVGGGVIILVILVWAFSSSTDDAKVSKPKPSASKK